MLASGRRLATVGSVTPEQLAFLFGPDVAADDHNLDDPMTRSMLIDESFDDELTDGQLAALEAVAEQIITNSPAEVWATAERLLAGGMAREQALRNLMFALVTVVASVAGDDRPHDPDEYQKLLARLPTPDARAVEAAVVATVRANPGISDDDLDAAVLATLGRDTDDELTQSMLDDLLDSMSEPDIGPLAVLAGERYVVVDDLIAGIVLTRRLNEFEFATNSIAVAPDLSGFGRLEVLTDELGNEIMVFSVETGHVGWRMPAGWFDRFEAGQLVAFRVSEDAVLSATTIEDPPLDEQLVEDLRAAYDREIGDEWLPVTGEVLLLDLLLANRVRFDRAQLPLAELCAAAGLECRVDSVAHDDTVWYAETEARRYGRVAERAPDNEICMAVLRVMATADSVAAIPGATDGDVLDGREVLRALARPDVLASATMELFDSYERDHERRAGEFVDFLFEIARRPHEIAMVRFLAAVLAERNDDTPLALEHLQLGHRADPTYHAVVDRLAWYASDRGDAATAVRLWHQLSLTDTIMKDLGSIEAIAVSNQQLGRNERCWCGSGRKFKQCHLGRAELPALPDRVGWMCRKAVAFLERRGGEAQYDVLGVAIARAVDPQDRDSILAAFDDPIVMDLVLHEGEWFTAFLRERGSLLPEDEQLLLASWNLVERTVYEVMETTPGQRMTVRDLRTGDHTVVSEKTFSRQAEVGTLVCARAVPDGIGNQFIGGLFPVGPGRENDVLDMLDRRDPLEIATYVGGLYRAPILVGPDGRRMVLPRHAGRLSDEPELTIPDDAMEEIRDMLEHRWCDESVPALGGVTPREAAADPTRRDGLIRLINSFERSAAAPGSLSQRPERLRLILGLD